MEFLGNKTALLPVLREVVGTYAAPGARVADVFCGTASVSAALRTDGYAVDANDQLPLCATWARAVLLNPPSPRFAGLAPLLGPLGPDPYERVVAVLSDVAPLAGWVTSRYTPRSVDSEPVERRYLSEANGRVVDAVRDQIAQWRPHLLPAEHALLLATLVDAVVRVSNIAGTYGCYLKEWKPRALRPLELVPLHIPVAAGDGVTHRVTCADAEHAVAETDAEVVYADPPYTKRQYAAYYHLLNTLVGEDEPALNGTTGLPDWRQWASDWCYARRAPAALERLVAKSSAPVFVLSYSSDGHIAHEVVVDVLTRYGDVTMLEQERRRFRSSRLAHRSPVVVERIYVVRR